MIIQLSLKSNDGFLEIFNLEVPRFHLLQNLFKPSLAMLIIFSQIFYETATAFQELLLYNGELPASAWAFVSETVFFIDCLVNFFKDGLVFTFNSIDVVAFIRFFVLMINAFLSKEL
jgi:hypothetical protein